MAETWHDLATMEGHMVGEGFRLGESISDREARALRLQDRAAARFERITLDADLEAVFAEHFEPVDHPNVIPVWDRGVLEPGVGYLITPDRLGPSLDDLLEEGPFTPSRAVHVLADLVSALRALHSVGLTMPNLRPVVIRVTSGWQGDRVRIPCGPWSIGPAAGQALGGYCAPELGYADSTPASDQFPLGVMLFELLTGTPPHNPEAPPDERTQIPFLPHPKVPSDLEPVIRRLMGESPKLRYPGLEAVQSVLDALANVYPEETTAAGHYTPALPPGRSALPDRFLAVTPTTPEPVELPPVTPNTDRVVGTLVVMVSVFVVAMGLYAVLFTLF